MRAVSGMKMLIVLQLLLYFVICSDDKKLCATYYTENKKKGTPLYVEKNEVKKGRVEKFTKVKVEKGCLFFLNDIVYDQDDTTENDEGKDNGECCCEFYNNSYQRFLNRHQLISIDDKKQHFNGEMKERCIPTKGRTMHSFVLANEDQLKKICGKENDVNCISKEKFKVYNVKREKKRYYNNQADIIKEAQIVVKCNRTIDSNAILPIHFACVISKETSCDVKYQKCN